MYVKRMFNSSCWCRKGHTDMPFLWRILGFFNSIKHPLLQGAVLPLHLPSVLDITGKAELSTKIETQFPMICLKMTNI